MPIYFVSMLDAKRKVVLQASYEKQQFKTQIEQKTSVIKPFHQVKFEISRQVHIWYKNLSRRATCAIVVSSEVDLQEIGDFFDEILEHIEKNVLQKSSYVPPNHIQQEVSRQEQEDEDEKLYAPLN